ncbi:MAG TPA: transaldolase [Trueperaceae bacterium]|nr:transaldolase [Trueperaceae bacterium]
MNPLKRLQQFGQSIYLDEIRRSWLSDGTLKRLIEEDGLHGVTSNPAIFAKAITGSRDYDTAISTHATAGDDVAATYESLVIQDIQNAADAFRQVYDESGGRFGFVSLEVSPELADDTEGTITEGRHLWQRLARPNVFIKVPATQAGLGAITALTRDGINVNVTLLFGLERYQRVIDAYLTGLEQRVGEGKPIAGIISVASFFLSRIDTLLDPRFDEIAASGSERADKARDLRGTVAIASAKVAYSMYQEAFGAAGAWSERFAPLAAKGAEPQRLLWASTGTKDPSYSDVKYVEPLVGPDTINTLPLDTLNAYRDHGQPAERVTDDVDVAHAVIAALPAVGIDLTAAADELEREGVEKFITPFRGLLSALGTALTKDVVPASD